MVLVKAENKPVNGGEIRLAVDNCIFTIIDGKLNVLLIKMVKAPYSGRWALPGGMVGEKEEIDVAVKRILKEQTNVDEVYLEQLYTFGGLKRDPFGRVVSVAYFALIPADNTELKTSPKYAGVEFRELEAVGKLAYDHNEMLAYAVSRLRMKLEYTNVVYSLLAERFTLKEMQDAYEAILDRKLDKRNFRKKINSLGIIKNTGKKTIGEKHRPAALYRFIRRSPKIVEML